MNAHELKARRLALGATQRELGQKANIAQQHLSQMEAGERAIGLRTEQRLAYALGALEADQQARRRLIQAAVDRVMERADMLALRERYAQMDCEL